MINRHPCTSLLLSKPAHTFTLSTDLFKAALFLFARSAVCERKREDPCSGVGVSQACSHCPPSLFSSPRILFLSLHLPSFSTLLATYLSEGYKFKGRFSHPALFSGRGLERIKKGLRINHKTTHFPTHLAMLRTSSKSHTCREREEPTSCF